MLKTVLKKVTQKPEEKLRENVEEIHDISTDTIIDLKNQKLDAGDFLERSEAILDRCESSTETALKTGNKQLYIEFRKFMDISSKMYENAEKLVQDETLMIELLEALQSFVKALVEYDNIVNSFKCIAEDLEELSTKIGKKIGKVDSIGSKSKEAARAYEKIRRAIGGINLKSYTSLTALVPGDEKFAREFEERRRKLEEELGSEDGKDE